MGFIDLLLPRICASCRTRARGPLCGPCTLTIQWIREPVCECCGHPMPGAVSSCHDCRGRGFAFRRARQAAVYSGAARDALKAFKLLGDRRSAASLATPMIALATMSADAVTFVPSDRAVESERGFNPAEALARPFAAARGLPLVSLLRKTRRTADSASLGRDARRAGLAGAFAASPGPARVLLVDDIFTTGATADACAAALLAAGAHRVEALAFARSTRYAPAGPRHPGLSRSPAHR